MIRKPLTQKIAEKFLTSSELAARTGKSQRTLKHWRLSGGGPKFSYLRTRVRYKLTDVVAWEKAQLAA